MIKFVVAVLTGFCALASTFVLPLEAQVGPSRDLTGPLQDQVSAEVAGHSNAFVRPIQVSDEDVENLSILWRGRVEHDMADETLARFQIPSSRKGLVTDILDDWMRECVRNWRLALDGYHLCWTPIVDPRFYPEDFTGLSRLRLLSTRYVGEDEVPSYRDSVFGELENVKGNYFFLKHAKGLVPERKQVKLFKTEEEARKELIDSCGDAAVLKTEKNLETSEKRSESFIGSGE